MSTIGSTTPDPSHRTVEGGTTHTSSGRPLTALDEAPPALPAVDANGVVVPPTQYRWMTDGEWDVVEVDDPAALVIPVVDLGSGLTLRVDSPVAPEVATLYEYRDLDDSGRPAGAAARTIDCLAGGACEMSADASASTIEVREARPGAIVTLVLLYGRSTRDDSRPVVMLSSSWALRLRA